MEHTVQSNTLAMRAKSYNGTENTFTVHCEKSKTVSFVFSIMKNIILLFAPSRFQ